ncbi:MAG TPA: PP2C family protein-serine/threonine phosphatase [Dermatophilaceae bacterium]|nr:PP2C family protein-serine/threonine phosphatase [Dermatophilaceae bacterium]
MTTYSRRLARRRRATARRHASEWVRGIVHGLPAVAALIFVLAAGFLAALLARWPLLMPWTIFVPVIVLAGLFLPPRWLALVLLFIAGLLTFVGWYLSGEKVSFTGNLVVTLIVAATMTWLAVSRARLGVQGTLGESMLVDLRDRLRAHGQLPTLPEPWHAEAALQPAYGESFSGDFLVASSSCSGNRLEIALVDVSGKGVNAGTRALLLSGAFGGLLGAMDPADFLGAANSYLLRQNWSEGFATAIHVALDLDTGRFSVGGAGHPPAVKFAAGSGLWEILDAESGPLLGVMGGTPFPRTRGRLRRGDALLLYTDGVIESRTRDLNIGIDRMLGAAERFGADGFTGGASRICAAALAGKTDDRAVVLIWRS